MKVEIKIPPVGESINEVTIGQWLIEDGVQVEMDDPICELESEKATFELNAENPGMLIQKANEGDTLQIGDVIGLIDTDAKPKAEKVEEKKEKAPEQSPEKEPGTIIKTGKKIEMHVPTVGESITEVTIASWNKEEGALVALDEVIAEIDSDKATFELTAEAQGYLHIIEKEGATLEIGALLCSIEEVKGAVNVEHTDVSESTPVSTKPAGASDHYAAGHPSPAASKILQEKGISANSVAGTGKDGRITKEDAVRAEKQPAKKTQGQGETGETKKQFTPGERTQRRVKMTTLRKTISRRLVAVKNETAMLTTFNEVNMKPIMDIRKKYKESFKEKFEVNLGFMSFFTKACCVALQEWPSVNAMIDEHEIIYNDYCDISIAVSSDRGLVVPVIRDAESLTFEQIEKEVVYLATRARDGKLSIEEMQGGTFTITNGGVFGSMMSTPILNAPQSAILGMHNIVERPVAVNGEIVIHPMMYIALSYDHRIIDGRESVSFLVRVKELLEDPTRLLLGV